MREHPERTNPAGSFPARLGRVTSTVTGEDAATIASPAPGKFSAAGRDSLPASLPISTAPVVEPVTSVDYARAPETWLVAVVGPTAAGKSALALELADRLDGEIVNFDSVQLYTGFDIGSGKLRPQERRGIPHHLLDVARPKCIFTAGDFARAATQSLGSLRERNKLPVLVGGTGLYLRSLIQGLSEGPARSDELRGRLRSLSERHGRGHLHRILMRLDPLSAKRIDPRDTQKIIRALEVRFLTGRPISAAHAEGRKGLRGFVPVMIGLDPERAALHQRINARVESMFQAGLVEETQTALEQWEIGPEEAARFAPFGALGYRQACEMLAGRMDREEAIRATQAATRQYAKRQMTWFRREAGVQWFAGFGDSSRIQQNVLVWLKSVISTQCAAGRYENLPR